MDSADATLVAYRERLLEAKALASTLTARVQEILVDVPHVDRISFRTKTVESFATKAVALDERGVRKYGSPLREIEDQIAGRVLVFFRDDIASVTDRLTDQLGPVENVQKQPERESEFGYESNHLVFVIPSHLKPERWTTDPTTPNTFEMQVRTLFMHAWAEPQHDLGYKTGTSGALDREQRRRLAWIAASAWGADQMLNDLARGRLPRHDG